MNSLKVFLLSSALALTQLTTPLFAANVSSNDAGSLATIAAIDKNEILISVIAKHNDVSSDLKSFAKMMIDQHGDNLTQILHLSAKIHGFSLGAGSSKEMAAAGMKDMLAIGRLQGDAFGRAYINAMVKGHTAALDLLDHKLIPEAKSAEIKKFLTDTRSAVATHLEDAKKVQSNM